MKLLIGILLLTASPVYAQVYKCEVNGVTVFSQQPCADDAEEVAINHSQPTNDTGSTNIEEMCLEFIRESRGWKDRESLRVEGSYKTWVSDYSGSRHVMVLMINAKNTYGGYVGPKPFECFLNHSGNALSNIQHRVERPKNN